MVIETEGLTGRQVKTQTVAETKSQSERDWLKRRLSNRQTYLCWLRIEMRHKI